MPLLNEFEKLICAFIFMAMTVLGFLNVMVRYLTNYSFAATQEILLNGFLLLTVFGAAIAARRGEHIAVTLVTNLLPRRSRLVIIVFTTLLSMLLLILSAWFTFEMTVNEFQIGVRSSGLEVPNWYYSASLPLGFLLVALRLGQGIWLSLKSGDL